MDSGNAAPSPRALLGGRGPGRPAGRHPRPRAAFVSEDLPAFTHLSKEDHALVELCLHLANLFYLASFLGRDMLWLRALTCAGLTLGIVFFSCQATPLYGPTAWHAVFLVINAVQIRLLVRERSQLRLSREQERFGEAAFHDLSRDELLTLLTHVMSEDVRGLPDLRRACEQPLDPDERALRDLAFNRLTRQELLNLLTRRLWTALKRRGPDRW